MVSAFGSYFRDPAVARDASGERPIEEVRLDIVEDHGDLLRGATACLPARLSDAQGPEAAWDPFRRRFLELPEHRDVQEPGRRRGGLAGVNNAPRRLLITQAAERL